MKRYFLLGLIVISIYGCGAPAFQIISDSADKFTDKEKPETIMGINNRLSTKSSIGGVHIDEKGVYIDPFATRDRRNGEIQIIGFNIFHQTFTVNEGFIPIRQIIFLNDKNERIEMSIRSEDESMSLGEWNSISKTYIGTFQESGITKVTKEEYNKICESKWIEVKIIGDKLSQTYNKDEIDNTFLQNLKQFKQNIGI